MESVTCDEANIIVPKYKKRRKHGRIADANKIMKLQLHETGENCNCRLKCFVTVNEYERKDIGLRIKRMNSFRSQDEINIYLSGLISICQVECRRPRQIETEALFKDVTNKFHVGYVLNQMRDTMT